MDNQAVFMEYAQSDSWVVVHFAQWAAALLLSGGLVALYYSIRTKPEAGAGVAARFGFVAAVLTAAAFTMLQAVDGVALKWAVDAWAGAPADQQGAAFAAALFKSNDADLMRFSDDARYVQTDRGDSMMNIAQALIKNARSAGTNFHAIFQAARTAYDRIIILSDMQGWMGAGTPNGMFEQYKTRTGANPFVYSFDLAGYGSLQLPEQKVFCLAGFSDKVFDIMQLLESDREALVRAIRGVEWQN